MNEMNVDRWVELFEAIGVDRSDRHRWHVEFEKRYPDGHRSFLEWLGLDSERISAIRNDSRAGVA